MANLDAIGIVCADIDAALSFYRLLGVDVPHSANGEDHVEAKLPNGLRLMFDSEELMKRLTPDWKAPAGHRMALAFLCNDPEDVDAIYRRLTGKGHKGVTEPWDAFWGQRYAQVVDPSGNVVDLFAPL